MKSSTLIIVVTFLTIVSGYSGSVTPANELYVGDTNTADEHPQRPRGSVKSGFNATSAVDASIAVGASGGLSWSMNMRTPIGPGESGPNVRIFYTGRNHGLLGYGMAASGLGSSINRCNSSHQIDGYTKRFEWSVDDALCLDGARLILDRGEYGSSGARYGVMGKPNVFVEARFRPSDEVGSAFAVYYPSGRVDRYGYRNGRVRDDAVVYGVFDSGVKVPYAWHVSRSIDSSNNLTDYSYVYDDLSGEHFWSSGMVLDKPSHRLKRIDYGGLKVNEAADLSHSRRVDLIYDIVNVAVRERDRINRFDINAPQENEWVVSDGFVGGMRYRNRHVLSALESYAAGMPSWGYDFKYEKAPVSTIYKDVGLEGNEKFASTTLRLHSIGQRRTGGEHDDVVWHHLNWSFMRRQDPEDPSVLDRTALSGMGLDGKKFYSSAMEEWQDCAPEYQGVVSCIERPIHQVWGDFDGDGNVEALVAAYAVESKLEDYSSDSGEVAKTLSWAQVTEYREAHQAKFWEIWNLADGKPSKVDTNITIPYWGWMSTAGSGESSLAVRPPGLWRHGVMRDEKAHPAAWPIDHDGNARTDVLVGVPADFGQMGGLFMDPPYGLGSETLTSNRQQDNSEIGSPPPYCEDWESANEDERRVCRNRVYRNNRSPADLDGHPGHLKDLKVLSMASESTPEAPVWIEQSLNYPVTANPILWAQPLDLNGDGLADLAFCKANENFNLGWGDNLLPMFYEDDQNARYWTQGTLHYALNGANGLDLSNAGTPFNILNVDSCDFKDSYTVMDLYGDGRQSLLNLEAKSGYSESGQRHLSMNASNPYNYSRSKLEIKSDNVYPLTLSPLFNYRAYVLERDDNGLGESMAAKFTNLPLDLLARQGRGETRISTWQKLRNGDYYTVSDTGVNQLPNAVTFNTQEGYPNDLRFLQGGTYRSIDIGYGPSNMRTGDFNGDGLNDFASIEIPNYGCTKTKIYSEDNDYSAYPRSCNLADIAGDPKTSFDGEYFHHTPPPVVVVYFNRGDSSFERRIVSRPWGTNPDEYSGTIRQPHFSWNSAQVVDIDKDGVSDIVWLDRVAQALPGGGGCGEEAVCYDGYPSSEISVNVNLLPFYRGVDVAKGGGEVKSRRILKLHPFVETYRNDTTDPITIGETNILNMAQTELSMKGHGAQIRMFDLDLSGSLDFLIYHNLTSEWIYINGNPVDHDKNQSNPAYETGSPALNKLVSSRNAMGALTRITYDRLDNRMIEPYTTQDSWQGYPFIYAPRGQSVVGAVHKDNGMGLYQNPDFTSRHYYYGKPRFDRLRGLSLGPDRRLGLVHETTQEGSVTKSYTEYFNNSTSYSQEFRLYPNAGTLQRVVGLEYGSGAGNVKRYSHTSKSSPKFGHGTVPGVMWKRSGRQIKSTWEVAGSQQEHDLLYGCLKSAQDPFVGCDLDETNLNFQPMTLEKSNTTFDEFGFPTLTDISNGVETDERRVVTSIDYDHRIFEGYMPYRLGLVTKETVAEYTPGQGGFPVLRQREFAHDKWGRVEWILYDGHTAPEDQLAVEELYTYDARGNVLGKSTQGADGVSTSEESVFESTGVFPMHRINALGMQTNFEFWPQCGVLRNMTSLARHTEVTDVFESCDVHATQTYFYDQPISARTERKVNSLALSNHIISNSKDNVFISSTTVNRVGQTIETSISETAGKLSIFSFYDRLGRLLAEANPVKYGENVEHYVSYNYDQFGREVERIKPDGTSLKRLYNRHVVTTIDELGHKRIVENDSLGRPVRIEAPQDDLYSAAVCIDYGVLGLATHTGPCEQNSARSTTEMFYDFRGRLEWVNDAQTGMRYFNYDSFDRLVETTDAEGRVVRHNYDILGRPSTLIEDFGTAKAQTHELHWDQPFNGALQYASSPENQEWGVYDEFNRQVGRRLRLDDLDLITLNELDEKGRVKSTQYPSPAPVGCNDCMVEPLIVDYEYDNLDRVVGLYHQNQKLWESGDRDIWGNLVEQRFGNGVVARKQYDEVLGRLQSSSVTYETILDNDIVIETPLQKLSYQWYDNGWLKQRTRHNIGVANALNQELFDYHANGMLKSWGVTRDSGVLSEFVSYAMKYDSVGNILSSPMGSYDYQNERLSSVSGPGNATSYAYDANGNTTERVRNGLVSQLVYNARGVVVEVSGVQGNQHIERNTSGVKVAVHWDSGIDDDVIFEDGFENWDTGRSSYYATGFEMERGGSLGKKVIARYNLGKAHVVREWSNGLSEPMQETIQYITPPDHMGSTTLVTNAFGNVVDERSYDAWGRERNPDSWNQMLDAPMNDQTGFNSGYTGHERRPYGNGLIDMKARYYDPYTYRMIQADTVVPDPTRMVDWNRYVYVRNAPTQYSDPTGHSPSPNQIPDDPNTSAGWEVSQEFGLDHVVEMTGGKTTLTTKANEGTFGVELNRDGPGIGVVTDASGATTDIGFDMLLERANKALEDAETESRLVTRDGKVILQRRPKNTTVGGVRVINAYWEDVRTVMSIPHGRSSSSSNSGDLYYAFEVFMALRNPAIEVISSRLTKSSPVGRIASVGINTLAFMTGKTAEIFGVDDQSFFDFAALGYSGYLAGAGAAAAWPVTITLAAGGLADAVCDECVTNTIYSAPGNITHAVSNYWNPGQHIRSTLQRINFVQHESWDDSK